METVPEGVPTSSAAAAATPPSRILAEMTTGSAEILRVRCLSTGGEYLIEVRTWRRDGDSWEPADGFTMPAEQLPEFRRTLAHAEALIRSDAPLDSAEESSRAARERIRTLARQVALARERLESLRPEDYQRPQDYRRVRTLRLVDLRRQENVLARAQAGLLDEDLSG